jgi:hypothetical protein
MTKQNKDIMKQTKHVLTTVTKPCGGRFRVTILADDWVIDRYITCLPVVYALVLNHTQAEGIAKMTAWVRFLRCNAVRFEKAQSADPRVLAKIVCSKPPFIRGLVADGWFGSAARGLRERWKSDKRTLARLHSGREEYYEPYVWSYHSRRDLAIRAWRGLQGGQKLLDILEIPAPARAPIHRNEPDSGDAVTGGDEISKALDDSPPLPGHAGADASQPI